jgi:hypothetical protein
MRAKFLIMRNFKPWLLSLIGLGMFTVAGAHINPDIHQKPAADQEVSYRENCDNAISQIDQAVNNVRARLTTGGDVWWDGDDGRYVVPKVAPGVPEVSSIFAGAVWLGGLDDGGNLKVAAQTYGRSGGNFDFWPGPLIPDGVDQGEIEKETCAKWDRFFTVDAIDIDLHKGQFELAKQTGAPYDEAAIPRDVKGWPAKGNPYFYDIHEFELPNTSQGLAGFHDYDGDGNYDPAQGDYPIIEIRGCPDIYYGDEMIFWVYNDSGNSHAESGSPLEIKMEVQVQAFAYSTSDEINNMTFQRFKLINRAILSIDSTFFAWWVDPDLGCYTDDYVGCDVERSMAYVYNEDAVDGTTGCNCDQGVNTYCEEVPILGVDYFRGPLNENGEELGMSSFTYYNNGGVGSPEPGTTDPDNEQEYYNYMSGTWKDGSSFEQGGNGYQQGTEDVDYAFTDAPDTDGGWSMCTEDLPFGDRRTVQASGPFRLDPGAVNELIVGAVWVADQAYPCPSIRKLQEADDIAQKLFDECFNIPNGPDAPDVDFIELDQEIIAVLTNNLPSNNVNEEYAGTGLDIPAGTVDSFYYFEGYRIYQVATSDTDLSADNRADPEKVRIVAEVDIKNGVNKIFNWKALDEEDRPTAEEFFVPVLQIDAPDKGIRHTFKVTEDQFASGDTRLINHKKYYFISVAYAYNEYEAFDPDLQIGQKKAYFEGRKNIGPNQDGKPYTVIPRPTVDRKLNANYGDGAVVTRVDGVGTATNFLDISGETRAAIEAGFATATPVHEITYKAGRGPIDVLVYNPLDVKNGEFELTFVDEDMGNDQLDGQTFWVLKNLSNPNVDEIFSDTTIAKLNEQIIREYGFSIAIGQVADAGEEPMVDITNGFIGYEEEYARGEDANAWLGGIPDGPLTPNITVIDQTLFDYIQNEPGQEFDFVDPEQVYSNMPGNFVPYYMCNWTGNEGFIPDVLTPAWTNSSDGNKIVHDQTSLGEANNVDIVFTSNRDLWSRCVIVETANKWVTNAGIPTEGENIVHFDLRGKANVTQFDNDGDGFPDVDDNPDINLPLNGLGWFPGYAIDVETGQRLNIFFGENSIYDESLFPAAFIDAPTGRDMMFNPTSQILLPADGFTFPYHYYAGGQHYVYVTKQPYDGCAEIADRLEHSSSALKKVKAVKEITWAGLIMPSGGQSMLSYAEGLIPDDVTVKLRVNNPYEVEVGTGDFSGYPTYRFKIDGLQAEELDDEGVESALDLINVVPNPYYGFSDYEVTQFNNTVKITNLPAKCIVTIYSLDGKFIRQYDRDELGGVPKGTAIDLNQVLPDVEWDLKNNKGIPIASGVYLIHVAAEGLGERTLKWFGVNRQFDPNGY